MNWEARGRWQVGGVRVLLLDELVRVSTVHISLSIPLGGRGWMADYGWVRIRAGIVRAYNRLPN